MTKMKMANLNARPARQTGAGTLVMSIVLLILISMVGVYTGRAVLFEQKISANDFRERQAFEAAESGLSNAMSYLSQRGGADKDGNGVIDPVFDTDGDGVGDSTTRTFADNSSVTVAMTGAFPLFNITATGFSDDLSAMRLVRSVGATVEALPNPPDNPFTTRSSVILAGSATVHNPEGHSTIWSGDDVDLGSNNATATNIADPAGATYPTCMDTPMTCTTTRSSTKVAVGLDVIEYDTQLSNLSVEQMFINFFGTSMANYQESRVTLQVDAANVNNLATADPPGVNLATGEVIWVEGNADIGKVTVGCAVSTTGGNICPAASVDPSITIINGDLTTSGTPQFYGFLYVTGRVYLSSNTTVHGAIVVSGDLQSTTSGSLDVWYNSDYLNRTRDNGPLGGAPGSWRDW